jgi:hypothetical protein
MQVVAGKAGRSFLALLVGWSGLALSGLILGPAYGLMIWSSMTAVPFFFGWCAKRWFALELPLTVGVAFADIALPGAAVYLGFTIRLPFIFLIAIGWALFSMLGWYTANKFGAKPAVR